jgi:hypothetical protein
VGPDREARAGARTRSARSRAGPALDPRRPGISQPRGAPGPPRWRSPGSANTPRVSRPSGACWPARPRRGSTGSLHRAEGGWGLRRRSCARSWANDNLRSAIYKVGRIVETGSVKDERKYEGGGAKVTSHLALHPVLALQSSPDHQSF